MPSHGCLRKTSVATFFAEKTNIFNHRHLKVLARTQFTRCSYYPLRQTFNAKKSNAKPQTSNVKRDPRIIPPSSNDGKALPSVSSSDCCAERNVHKSIHAAIPSRDRSPLSYIKQAMTRCRMTIVAVILHERQTSKKKSQTAFAPSFHPSILPSFVRSIIPSFLRSFVPSFVRRSSFAWKLKGRSLGRPSVRRSSVSAHSPQSTVHTAVCSLTHCHSLSLTVTHCHSLTVSQMLGEILGTLINRGIRGTEYCSLYFRYLVIRYYRMWSDGG